MPKAIDLIGKQFGNLKVVSFAGHKGDRRQWWCGCVCGREVLVSSHDLRCGDAKSCGCSRRKPGSAFRRLLIVYKANARKDGKTFELTDDQFHCLTSSNCHYCGSAPNQIQTIHPPTEQYLYNGIDRVNPFVGYVVENCVPCCFTCNRMKSDFGQLKFLNAIRAIYHHLIKPTEISNV